MGWVPRMVGGSAGVVTTPVAVLLSVHNGEAYLNAQLDSILAQTYRDWVVYWRDDGSEDASRAIMLSFQTYRGQGRCVEVSEPVGCLGVAASYGVLLEAVPPERVIAFADQDDVWFPEKLGWGVAALGEEKTPALYCARQVLTDSALTPKGRSAPVRRPPVFAAALTQNIATGHTVMLNPPAAALLRGFAPPPGVLHDWWAYLVVSAAGGRVIADPRCVSFYRQHGRNTVGARSWWSRAVAAVRRGPRAFMAVFAANLARLAERPEQLSPEAARLIGALRRALPRGAAARFGALWRWRGLVRQTRAETALFRLWFVLAGG